jgi:hypothetical protein
MEKLSQRLDRLGDAVAEVVDEMTDRRELSSVRRRLLAPSDPKPQRWFLRRAGWSLAGAAAAVMVVVAGLALWPDAGSTTSFQVGDPPRPGEVGAWVAAARSGPTRLSFWEGSAVTLEAGTRARVTELTARGATVLVERGTLRAAVVHKGIATRWAVHAGPFSVDVVGTTFVAHWDPDQETLRVVVEEGEVLASGPLLTPARRVSAGERLTVSIPDNRMALVKLPDGEADAPNRASSAAPAACAPCAQPEPEQAPALNDASTGSSATPAEASSGPSWRSLAAAGKHREAMALLDREGFESHVASASAEDLRTLADIARFAGQTGRAKHALLELRRKHGVGGSTAFVLGRIELAQGSSAQAVQWFETYLQEAPSGPLAEQALGRIFDIQRHGKPESARRAAKRYLARYPRGAYAALARSVLDR